ncbi:hepatic sodium/bile acid cotransporter-like [Periophthalmus magnuspinnatus]|uniref:hepatic sodium/bile acid cotransporter-like n=1 Tax=Periophthalmus magnuspinnatus TaxID=409849 RepID=UPI00145A23DA|nr:hepatic sodium/bile acid cotransporter-like [Periophthalmus magnuspinnatus]
MDEFTNMSVLDLRNDSLNGPNVSSLDSPTERITKSILIVSMLVVMVSVGCTMELTKIMAHLKKPKGVGIAVVAQYGIMPLTAFCLAKAFDLTGISATVVLICGCCPAGIMSNILSLFIKGDMNLSIVMTSCSTVLAFGMMPLLLFLYCQGFEGLQEAVPYKNIALSLLSILIPCGIGILLNHYRPQYSNIITKVGLSVSLIAILLVLLTIIEAGEKILSVVVPPMLAIAFLMPMFGYFFGYIFSTAFKLKQPERRTVMMETGCQNGKLCMALIKVAFPSAVVGPLFLYPLVIILTQLLEGLLVVLLFWAYQSWQQRKNKVGYEAGHPEVC